MLVLSRRTNEKIIIPAIRTAVQVVAVKPGVVRLGIEAPPEVTVLREEVLEAGATATARPTAKETPSLLQRLSHQLRNRLNAANIGLALLRRQWQAGLTTGMGPTLDKIEHEIRTLQQQIETAAKPTPAPRRVPRALLVEDDHNERELFAGFLRLAGMEVALAGDGAAALDYLREEAKPDVVLLDMMLPHCDGATTVREIRKNPAFADLKIFAVSGHTPEGLGLQPEAAGIDRWFHKPVNPEALLQDLQRELQRVD